MDSLDEAKLVTLNTWTEAAHSRHQHFQTSWDARGEAGEVPLSGQVGRNSRWPPHL